MKTPLPTARWRTPETLLIILAAAMSVSFSVWYALLNNFVVERAAFTAGLDYGAGRHVTGPDVFGKR